MKYFLIMSIPLFMFLAGGWLTLGTGDWTFNRKIEGKVVNTGSRFTGTQRSNEEYAVQLELSDSSDETIYLDHGPLLVVTCPHVNCSVLGSGDVVQMKCKIFGSIGHPDEVYCRLTKVSSLREDRSF